MTVQAQLRYERVNSCIYSITIKDIDIFEKIRYFIANRESSSTRPFGTKVGVKLRSQRVDTLIYTIFSRFKRRSVERLLILELLSRFKRRSIERLVLLERHSRFK